MHNIIEIKNLKKYFKDIKAVNNISFNVKEGEFFAFLGLNGAGKSTTINIICGNIPKDSGKILIDNEDIDKSLDKITTKLGIVYQDSILDKQLSVFDNLKYRASLYGITGERLNSRLKEIDKLLNIRELLKRKFGKLSGGQRRKIDIARAIIHNPKILILDEPTTGLDPQTRKIVWNALSKLRSDKNLTIFLTTHYMEETIDADNVVILDNGKVVAEGSPIELKNRYTKDYIIIYNLNEEKIKKLKIPYERKQNNIKIEVKNTKEATDLILKFPEIFEDYEITKGKMDDVFLNVTGKESLEGEQK